MDDNKELSASMFATPATAAPVEPQPVPAAIESLVSALAESKGWLRDYARSVIEDAIDRKLQPVELPEPEFFTAFAPVGDGWVPLPGYSNETEHGVKSLVLDAARREGYKGTVEGRLFALGWSIQPVYSRAALAAQAEKRPFQSAVASRKWSELRSNGYTMTSLRFERDGKAGVISAWGAVSWGPAEKPTVQVVSTMTHDELVSAAMSVGMRFPDNSPL